MKTLYGMDFSDDAHVRTTLLYMLIFLILYFVSYKILRRKFMPEKSEYSCRLITFLHGLLACFFATYYVVLPSIGYHKGESFSHATLSIEFFRIELRFLIREKSLSEAANLANRSRDKHSNS
jgi:hypothetical protein